MLGALRILALLAAVTLSQAHMVITYPGWRGDNLNSNGTTPAQNPTTIGVDYVNGTNVFPYGMQWIYPCESFSLFSGGGGLSAKTSQA